MFGNIISFKISKKKDIHTSFIFFLKRNITQGSCILECSLGFLLSPETTISKHFYFKKRCLF